MRIVAINIWTQTFLAGSTHHARRDYHFCVPSKDLSAYSDPVVANFLLRHLFLCGVLYDPATGDIVYIPRGTHVYVEVQLKFWGKKAIFMLALSKKRLTGFQLCE